MNRWAAATILAANSNAANALNQIYTAADQEVAYVEENNRFYRWQAASTAAADGVSVVELLGTPVGTAGRWIIEGPPGPGKLPPGFSNLLSQNAGAVLLGQVFTANTVGGNPTETITLFNGATYTSVLFDQTNAVAFVHMALGNPNVQLRPFLSANVLQALIVDTTGVALPAAQAVYGSVMRILP